MFGCDHDEIEQIDIIIPLNNFIICLYLYVSGLMNELQIAIESCLTFKQQNKAEFNIIFHGWSVFFYLICNFIHIICLPFCERCNFPCNFFMKDLIKCLYFVLGGLKNIFIIKTVKLINLFDKLGYFYK